MATTPFIYTDRVVLAANGSGTLQYTVGAGETAHLQAMFQAATGAFSITAIRTSTSTPYTDASPSNPLPSSLLVSAVDENGIGAKLEPTLDVVGPLTLNIDVLDTSGAPNTVTIAFQAAREIGGA